MPAISKAFNGAIEREENYSYTGYLLSGCFKSTLTRKRALFIQFQFLSSMSSLSSIVPRFKNVIYTFLWISSLL